MAGFYAKLGYNSIHLPFAGDWLVGWLIIPIFAFAVVATGNAVNISDGLDGLAGGLLAVSFAVFGVIALLQGHTALAGFALRLWARCWRTYGLIFTRLGSLWVT